MTRPSVYKSKWSSNLEKFLIRSLRHKAKSTESPSVFDVLAETDSNLSSTLHFLKISDPEIVGDQPIDDLTIDWKRQRALHTALKDDLKTSCEPQRLLYASTGLMAQTEELLLKAKAASESTIIGRIERRKRTARADVETKLSQPQLNNTRLTWRPTRTPSLTNPFEPIPDEEVDGIFTCA